MNHLTNDDLYAYADGNLPEEDRMKADLHLRGCASCRERSGAIRTLDRAIRSVPLERASPGLSREVLSRLGLRETPSWVYTLLKNIAPLVALTAVVAVAYVAIAPSGGPAEATGAGESARGLLQTADRYSAMGVQSINAWMGTYFSFAKNSAGLMGFLVVFLGAIALLDRFVVMPMFRKRV
jgi:anti-sigma factor RsiW